MAVHTRVGIRFIGSIRMCGVSRWCVEVDRVRDDAIKTAGTAHPMRLMYVLMCVRREPCAQTLL